MIKPLAKTQDVEPGTRWLPRREAGLVGLLFASTTSMIGSGWLFGSFNAARIAGPLSVYSWAAGAIITLLIALVFAELAALFPKSGALVHMSYASHGEGLGRIWAWMLFLAYAPVPPVEAEAILTYANNYLPIFVRANTDGLMTSVGLLTCASLLGVLSLCNLLAIRVLLKLNSTVTWWKIAIPVVTVVMLIVSNDHSRSWLKSSSPKDLSSVFVALPMAGIVFSFLGFRTAIDLGGESSNPRRHIPLAVIGSVLLSALIYVLLQVAFLVALRPADLAHGWASLNFPGAAGPLAGLAASAGLTWLSTLLYVDSCISPGGTGLIYVTGGSRILFALGELQLGPRWLMTLSRAGVPWGSVLVMWVVGLVFLLPFPAWQLMANYITSITVLTYGLGPVVLLVLRKSQPDLDRPFRLFAPRVMTTAAFVSSNWVVYWSGFRTDSFLFALIAAGFLVYLVYRALVPTAVVAPMGWRHIAWLAPWFGGLWIISAASDIDGGYGVIGLWWSMLIVTAWSLVVLWLATMSALPDGEVAAVMSRMRQTTAFAVAGNDGDRASEISSVSAAAI